jgi:hypothetical protein
LRDEVLLDYCQPRGIVLTSSTPVAKGEVAQDPTILRIGRKRGASPAQVARPAFRSALPACSLNGRWAALRNAATRSSRPMSPAA